MTTWSTRTLTSWPWSADLDSRSEAGREATLAVELGKRDTRLQWSWMPFSVFLSFCVLFSQDRFSDGNRPRWDAKCIAYIFLLIFRYYTSIVHFNLNFKPFSFHDVSYTFFFTLLRLFIVLSQIFSSSSSTSTTMIRRHFLWIYLGHLKDGCRGRASCHPHGIMKFTTNYSV